MVCVSEWITDSRTNTWVSTFVRMFLPMRQSQGGFSEPRILASCEIGQYLWTSLVVQMIKNCMQCRISGFNPWVGKIPWRRKWQPTPVFLPGESHGQRRLAGYSPWGHKESDTTEWLTRAHTHTHTHIHTHWWSIRFSLGGTERSFVASAGPMAFLNSIACIFWEVGYKQR